MQRLFFTILFLCLPISFANEPSCQNLVDSLTEAFDKGNSVISEVTIKQGKNEVAYIKSQLEKDDEGEWQTEILERRGMRRPGGDDEGDGEQGEFEFSCEGHELLQTETGNYQLELLENDPDIPVSGYTLEFDLSGGWYVPQSIIARFEAKILLIPVKGTFTTLFSEWSLPTKLPVRD